MEPIKEEQGTEIIGPRSGWFDINLSDLWRTSSYIRSMQGMKGRWSGHGCNHYYDEDKDHEK